MSVIILDQPISAFISNSKDSVLKSMIIDLSISSTEETSPLSYIMISPMTVTNLVKPIQFTVPIYSALNTSNPNNTFACGYIDGASQIFSHTGVSTSVYGPTVVNCMTTHLTAFAIEQFSDDAAAASTSATKAIANATANVTVAAGSVTQSAWSSWAVYVQLVLVFMMFAGLIWARRRDAADEVRLPRIKKQQKKIYVNLFLEPIKEIQKKEPIKSKKTSNYEKVKNNESQR